MSTEPCPHLVESETSPATCLNCGIPLDSLEAKLRRELRKAREIVKRFIVAQGPHLSESWHDALIKECGLVEDSIGFVQVPPDVSLANVSQEQWTVLWEPPVNKGPVCRVFKNGPEAYAFYERQSGQGMDARIARVVDDQFNDEAKAPRTVGPIGWDRRFLELARHVAGWSKDPSTKVGCVIVGPDREIRSTGFNGFPRGVADDDRLNNREQKYPLVCHGEENCILHAARLGVPLRGCTSYCTWPPCTRCASSLIQAGIAEVVYPAGLDIPERWQADFQMSMNLLTEAGVTVRTV